MNNGCWINMKHNVNNVIWSFNGFNRRRSFDEHFTGTRVLVGGRVGFTKCMVQYGSVTMLLVYVYQPKSVRIYKAYIYTYNTHTVYLYWAG